MTPGIENQIEHQMENGMENGSTWCFIAGSRVFFIMEIRVSKES